MPISVRVALTAAFLPRALFPPYALLLEIEALGIALMVAPGLLILVGIFFGNRLAWQASRLAPFFGAICAVGAGGGHLIDTFNAFVTLGVPYSVMEFALARPAARAYFRLVCPACGAALRATALVFDHARCRKCQRVS